MKSIAAEMLHSRKGDAKEKKGGTKARTNEQDWEKASGVNLAMNKTLPGLLFISSLNKNMFYF
ncbi:MAG: hypothetical protein U9R49_09380 [Bacteroidota bacterium]|nr:hypothetical protein [Bacteroidota bacterium]